MTKAPTSAPVRNKTPLALPFKGRWFVVWGGDTAALNYHHDTPNQRYAFDILGVGPGGKTRKGRTRKNEDYDCFGRELLAPADGVVTEAIDGVRDNAPGSMNRYSALGNAVLIQHGPAEISVLAHLKRASVRVRAGERVLKGQVIGLCGNSGNSSEPHLHYHLQNTPIIQDGAGVKVFFERLTLIDAKGKKRTVADYSPVKGDILSSP